jgi:hypothetical protein
MVHGGRGAFGARGNLQSVSCGADWGLNESNPSLSYYSSAGLVPINAVRSANPLGRIVMSRKCFRPPLFLTFSPHHQSSQQDENGNEEEL